MTWAEVYERADKAERRVESYIIRGRKGGRASVAKRSQNPAKMRAHMLAICSAGGKAQGPRNAEMLRSVAGKAGKANWAKRTPAERRALLEKMWAARRAQAAATR